MRGRGGRHHDRRRFRGPRGGGRRPRAMAPASRTQPERLNPDPELFWRAPADPGVHDTAPPAEAGLTLKRLGSPPDGDAGDAVEAALRRTWAVAAAAAASLLRR